MSGQIKKILDVQTFKSGFAKREIVVTNSEDKYPQEIPFEFLKEKMDLLNGFSEGDAVTVHFDIRGREYNGRWFVSLAAWKIEKGTTSGSGDAYPEDTTDYSVETEEPPF